MDLWADQKPEVHLGHNRMSRGVEKVHLCQNLQALQWTRAIKETDKTWRNHLQVMLAKIYWLTLYLYKVQQYLLNLWIPGTAVFLLQILIILFDDKPMHQTLSFKWFRYGHFRKSKIRAESQRKWTYKAFDILPALKHRGLRFANSPSWQNISPMAFWQARVFKTKISITIATTFQG